MPVNIGQEMALPMDQIIGGPLQAIVKAQALSALTTADFIQTVGLQTVESETKARTIAFSFDRKVADGTTGTATESVSLNVPLLAILPTPWIRVEEAHVDFECKVSSQTLSERSTAFGVDASASGGFWGVKVDVKASYSQKNRFSDTVNRQATLSVRVKAVQDEIPAGLGRMIGILETAITDDPSSSSSGT